MKRSKGILFLLLLLLSACWPEKDLLPKDRYPDGTPVTMYIGFGARDFLDVQIGTKAEASPADESRVHDLYVMLFDSAGNRFYNRYFTYEHLETSISTLNDESNEGWYVENTEDPDSSPTRGVVKISTEAKEGCTLVVLANLSNPINNLDDKDPVDRLAEIQTLNRLKEVKVTLEQELVNRTNLFLMLGVKGGLNTGEMKWGTLDPETTYDPDYKLELKTLVAKIKFCISYDDTNIDASRSTPRYWQVFNVPSSCYLMPNENDPEAEVFFNTTDAYFDGVETIDGKEWQVFSFYMLENRKDAKQRIEALQPPDYYLREKQEKTLDDEHPGSVKNGDWVYAPDKGTYVQFDMVLGLTEDGVKNILGYKSHALTSEALFTVHMGDFLSSDPEYTIDDRTHNYDNYDVERNYAYTYYITVENSKKIYIEVVGEGTPKTPREDEPGQEGSLLLTTDEIVNCDAHYEYHSLTFNYTPGIKQKGVSWYVKTPFSEGGAEWNSTRGDWDFSCDDYLWVKFAVNQINNEETYSESRIKFPGENEYHSDWEPEDSSPTLMDIHQLIKYIFYQTDLRDNGNPNDFKLVNPNNPAQLDPAEPNYNPYIIRVTAFVDEYYYEKDPTDPDATADPNLWRKFVNAKPRELHILADSKYSEDRRSDVITSSHSIIQQSIQTIYNIYSPDLTSLWGTEHLDEMSYNNRVSKHSSDQSAWPWWADGRSAPSGTRNDEENGRVNTATLWGLNDGPQEWETYLNNVVENNTPELNNDYKYLAYSCLTRNRDNDGDGKINPKEVRWYTASVNQLVGMWVGNEALTPTARIYQPKTAGDYNSGLNWRAWVVSSTASTLTNPTIIRAEEGCTRSDYNFYDWAGFNADDRNKVSSIRCVRNIGTFQQGGETKDISEAPYDYAVDKYYDIIGGEDAFGKALPNADGTYTVRFSRLNPISIREYTAEDLPSHYEYSEQNKVYLELIMQDPANYAMADGAINDSGEDINHNIDRDGYNKYCPSGYRLPNMTELLMMVSLQPSTYWNSRVYPCRTFYSLGSEGKQIAGEEAKVGWGYNKPNGRLHLIDEDTPFSGIRCVKDANCVGEITGKMSVPGGDDLRAGEEIDIQLNFSSQGSSFKDLALSLVYTDTNGREETDPIDASNVTLSGLTIRETVSYTIPADLPLLGNMYIRATVRNSQGVTRVFEAPIKVKSPVFASVHLLHCDYSENTETPVFPVMITASSPSDDITGWKLTIRDPEGETSTISATGNLGTHLRKYSGNEHHLTGIYDFNYTTGSLVVGTYTFQLDVTTNNMRTTRSDIASMDILKVNYQPNDKTIDDYADATEITNVWETQKVEGVDFYAGDFIEANMDVSNCVYKEVMKVDNPSQRDDNRTIGRDNLISIGLTDTDHGTGMTVPYVYHIYFPAHDGNSESGQDWLRPNVSTSTGASNGVNYKWFSAASGSGFVTQSSFAKPNIGTRENPVYQHYRFEKSGVYWNGQVMDFSRWGGTNNVNANNAQASFERLLSANTLYVGATQGYHRTRARYVFVRAVHNSASSHPIGGSGTGFDEDPINGGNL